MQSVSQQHQQHDNGKGNNDLFGNTFACAARTMARNGGFTLIELLAVIAIISVLASLLFPTLSRSKLAAHRIRCVGNLRQVSLGVFLYVDQYEAYPRFQTDKPVTQVHGGQVMGHWYWNDLIEDFVGDPWTNGVFRCPAYKFAQFYRNHIIPEINPSVGSYGYNGAEALSLSVWAGNRNSIIIRPSEVMVPSDMIAIGDSNLAGPWRALEYKGAGSQIWDIVGVGILGQHRIESLPRVADLVKDAERRRHGGAYNVGFCDGHVESIAIEKLYANNPNAWARWNIKNMPRP